MAKSTSTAGTEQAKDETCHQAITQARSSGRGSRVPARLMGRDPTHNNDQSDNDVTKSFEDFQTAIKVQMATMERIKAAAEDLRRMTSDEDAIEYDIEESHAGVEEYESTSDTDSDYHSHDGDADWQDEEDGADSEDSMTDPESVNSQCCSPVEEDTEEWSEYFGQPATAISVHF